MQSDSEDEASFIDGGGAVMGSGASTKNKDSDDTTPEGHNDRQQEYSPAIGADAAANRVMSAASATQSTDGRVPLELRLQATRNRDIDRSIAKERIELQRTIKILLLGGSESGKTTIFKQMRILHLDGFTKADLINYRYQIYSNVITALQQLLDACTKFRIVHENSVQGLIKDFQKFRDQCAKDNTDHDLSKELCIKMHRIWLSGPVQMCYNRRFEFILLDSAKYMLESLPRFSDPHYSPSHQDILQCRFRTTGIHELQFNYKTLTFKMVDVGGQRSERRKWIHCFDNVHLVLFIIAMADFDYLDPEENNSNRLLQNMEIFRTIAQSEYFLKASVVLFLNKKDIFKEKLVTAKFSTCFPDYKGENNLQDTVDFMIERFQQAMPDRKKLFGFVTTATDTRNVDLVFGSAVAHIVDENLKATGLQE